METIQRNMDQNRMQLRKKLRQQIQWGRMGILAILAVTLLNQILLLCKVNYHFHFSASLPYYLNWLSRQMGLGGFKAMAVILTILVYACYIACWLMSAQRREWLVAALGLYAVDTVLLIILAMTLLANPFSCLLEILTHGVGLALLWWAVWAANQLSRMPRPRPPMPTRQEP